MANPARVEVIGDCTLYLGDCRDILPTLGPAAAVVTDPPYGVLNEEWDDMTERELARFTMSWLALMSEVSDTLITFFAQNNRHVIDPLLSALYDCNRQMIWNKMGGRAAEDGMFFAYEPIYYCHPASTWSVVEPKGMEFASLLRGRRQAANLSKGAVDIAIRGKKIGLCYRWEEAACLPTRTQLKGLIDLMGADAALQAAYDEAWAAKERVVAMAREQSSRNAGRKLDVFTFAPVQGGPGRHPTENSAPLMASLIELVSEAGDLIVDPFNGSGTTGVACLEIGRRYVGIEKNPAYFDMACRRLEAAHRQPRLFSEPAAKVVQGAFDLEAD